MSGGDSPSPPLSQQQAQMSPAWLGLESGAGLALPPRSGRQSRHEGAGAAHGRVWVAAPGGLTGSGAGGVPRGPGRIPPCPSARSQPRQPPLLVQLLEEGLAEFVGADHDGAGGCHLNDTGQEACRDSPVSPSVTPRHP